jgi:hypothetical protein
VEKCWLNQPKIGKMKLKDVIMINYIIVKVSNKWDCTVDPQKRIVTEKVNGVPRIKWCNGYGDKFKLNWWGDLIGSKPYYDSSGKWVNAG